jgi:hypothetical protein
MSLWMRALVAAGAAGLMVATVWIFWSDSSLVEARVRELTGAVLPATGAGLAPVAKAAIFAISAPSIALGLFMLFQAWRLFGAYGRGQVFGPAAIGSIRKLAWALIGTALLRPATATATVLYLTWHNPPGQRQLALGVSWEDYLCGLFGGLLIAMAWAMTEAGRIERDNAGFI